MASLIFAHSKSIVTKAKKEAFYKADLIVQDNDKDKWKLAYDNEYNNYIERECKVFDEYLRVSSLLHERYLNTMNTKSQHYFITIRPDDTKCVFEDFKDKVLSFVKRKCFLDYTLTFEQKGLCPTELGKGFHAHIVANMKQRSKMEVIRDTLSSWNDWITKDYIKSNCIQVVTTRNPETIVNDYMIEYKSDDDHKEKTKNWDEIWRSNLSLEKIYRSG